MKFLRENAKYSSLLMGALIIFLLVNWFSKQFIPYQIDLSEEKLFTLSEGSVTLVSNLEKPVNITFYFSKSLARAYPQFGNYASRVEDMLKRLAQKSNDRIQLKIVDPAPFSEAEDSVLAAGLQAIPINDRGDTGYFGMVSQQADTITENTTIGFFQLDRERFLEYDIAQVIYAATRDKKPTIGIITGAEVFGSYQAVLSGGAPNPWVIIEQLGALYNIEQIYNPEGFEQTQPDFLLMIHPADLDPAMLYAVDQYLMRGGKAVIFADPWFESAPVGPAGGMVPISRQSDINKLMTGWGVTIPQEKVVADPSLGQMVNIGEGPQILTAPYPVWMKTRPANLNQQDVTLANIQSILLPSFGHIEVTNRPNITVEPLIVSTENADLTPTSDLESPDVRQILNGLKPQGQPYILAARIVGNLISAFPDGPPPPPRDSEEAETGTQQNSDSPNNTPTENSTEPASELSENTSKPTGLPHLGQAAVPANIILIADADLLVDRFWVQVQSFFGQKMVVPTSENGIFALNLMENLIGTNDLLRLRARGAGTRPFTKMDDIAITAEAQWRSRAQELSARMAEAEKNLAALEMPSDQGTVLENNPETEAALEEYRQELLGLRKELRAVNHALRQDLDGLEQAIRLINILLVPMLVIGFSLILAHSRRKRRQKQKLTHAV